MLQLAVQGWLVAQDLADELTSVLLERIRAEKARMVKTGKIKKNELVSANLTAMSCRLICPEVGNGLGLRVFLLLLNMEHLKKHL